MMALRLLRPVAALTFFISSGSCNSKRSPESTPAEEPNPPASETGGTSGSAGSGGETASNREEIYPITESGDDKAGAVAVDDDSVYWSQQSRGLLRAAKEGGGTPVRLGTWNAIAVGQELAVANRQAYWLDLTTLKTADADGNSSRELELPWYGSNVAVSGQFAYVTTRGCTAIGRVDLSAWTIETQSPEQVPPTSTGRSYLSLEGGDVYCGSWSSVFRFEGFSAGVPLTDQAEQVSGMTIAEGSLYYLDRTSDTTRLQRLSDLEAPSEPSTLATVNVLPQSPLLFDAPRHQLLFTSSGRLYAFSLESEELRVLAEIHSGGGLAVDETHAYFSNSTPNLASIERLRLE